MSSTHDRIRHGLVKRHGDGNGDLPLVPPTVTVGIASPEQTGRPFGCPGASASAAAGDETPGLRPHQERLGGRPDLVLLPAGGRQPVGCRDPPGVV